MDRASADAVKVADPAMNEASIAAAFEDWWIDSYGMPPGPHARMAHVAFAAHLLELVELMQQSQSRDPVVRGSRG